MAAVRAATGAGEHPPLADLEAIPVPATTDALPRSPTHERIRPAECVNSNWPHRGGTDSSERHNGMGRSRPAPSPSANNTKPMMSTTIPMLHRIGS